MSVYEVHKMKDPQLPFIFHPHVKKVRGEYKTNWHENLEIVCFIEGDGAVMLDSGKIETEAGDTVIINSNSIHGFIPNKSFEYYCLIVDRSFCIANHFDTNMINFDAHFYDLQVKRHFERLRAEWERPADSPYRTQAIRAEVLALMAYLCRNHSAATTGEKREPRVLRCIKQAIGYINAEYGRDISLDDVCKFVGLSKYYFVREFHRVTGYTFVAYVNMVRCEKAKVMLADSGFDVGEIGRLCGFVDQSYFTRVFRNYVGISPSKYQKS